MTTQTPLQHTDIDIQFKPEGISAALRDIEESLAILVAAAYAEPAKFKCLMIPHEGRAYSTPAFLRIMKRHISLIESASTINFKEKVQ